jgi:DNA-binding NarL/FixJ family response regulator
MNNYETHHSAESAMITLDGALVMLVGPYDVDRIGLEAILQEMGSALGYHTEHCESGLERIARQRFDAVLVDTHSVVQDPLVWIESIYRIRPEQVVLILADVENPKASTLASNIGVRGIVLKTDSPSTIGSKIQMALEGRSAWSKRELRSLSVSAAAIRKDAKFDHLLTEREEEVLTLITLAKTNRQISEELLISYETVKEHVQRILKKIGVKDRTQAAVWAKRRTSHV